MSLENIKVLGEVSERGVSEGVWKDMVRVWIEVRESME